MKKIIAFALSVTCLLVLCACSNDANYEKLLEKYYEEKLDSADSYSIELDDISDIDKSHSDYDDIIDYITDEFNCKKTDIKNLKEIKVNVTVNNSYTEKYDSFFIVGELKGDLMILDKDDGA